MVAGDKGDQRAGRHTASQNRQGASGCARKRLRTPWESLGASESAWECLGGPRSIPQDGPRGRRKRIFTCLAAPGDGTDRGGHTVAAEPPGGFGLRVLSIERTSGSRIRAASESLLSASRFVGATYVEWAGSLSARPGATSSEVARSWLAV